MTTAAALTLTAVRHGHPGGFRLDVPDLVVPHGVVTALLGPTGAGKSTLLSLLAGLDEPAAGRVSLHLPGAERRPWPLAVRRRVTLVFQRPLLLTASVRDNVAYGLRLRGAPDPDRVAAVLNELGLSTLSSRAAGTLSGGEAQMVALARAFVLEPDVLLLDEPTAHLDPARVAVVESAVKARNAARETTVVWATHNLFQARRVASDVALLFDGRLVEAGPASAFFAGPRHPQAAAFLRGDLPC